MSVRQLKKEFDDDDRVFLTLCGVPDYLICALYNFQRYGDDVSIAIHFGESLIRVQHLITVRYKNHRIQYDISYLGCDTTDALSSGFKRFTLQNVNAWDNNGLHYAIAKYNSTPIMKWLGYDRDDKYDEYNPTQMSFFIQNEYTIVVDAYKLFRLETDYEDGI